MPSPPQPGLVAAEAVEAEAAVAVAAAAAMLEAAQFERQRGVAQAQLAKAGEALAAATVAREAEVHSLCIFLMHIPYASLMHLLCISHASILVHLLCILMSQAGRCYERRLRIVSAAGLKGVDLLGKADPYAVVRVLPGTPKLTSQATPARAKHHMAGIC